MTEKKEKQFDLDKLIKQAKQEERERIKKDIKKIELSSKFMGTIERSKVLEVLNKKNDKKLSEKN